MAKSKPVLHVWRGLPGSGKTTQAKDLLKSRCHTGIYRVNRDDLRKMLHDGSGFSKTKEAAVRGVRDKLVRYLLVEGHDVITDDTNLRPEDLAHWQTIADAYEAEITVHDLRSVDVNECVRRDKNRPNYVGEAVIRRMHRDHIQDKETSYEDAPFLPSCVICDIDGTLATMCVRSPFDGTGLCAGDTPRFPVIEALKGLKHVANRRFILFSGRFGTAANYIATQEWLTKHGVPCHELYLRDVEDNRRDSLVKLDFFNEHVRGKYNVFAVFDDRNQVCRECWIPLGLGDRLFHVNPDIDNEF